METERRKVWGDTAWVFVRGFEYGEEMGRVPTAREVAEEFPDSQLSSAELDVFLNGAEDGVAGDRFRLNPILYPEEGCNE